MSGGTYPKENLQLFIEKYSGLRKLYAEETAEYWAYNQIVICLKNSHTLQEAKGYIKDSLEQSDKPVARSIYEMFLREGSTEGRTVQVAAPHTPKVYGLHLPKQGKGEDRL